MRDILKKKKLDRCPYSRESMQKQEMGVFAVRPVASLLHPPCPEKADRAVKRSLVEITAIGIPGYRSDGPFFALRESEVTKRARAP